MDTATDGDEAIRCLLHPNQETILRCSKCEHPICDRCSVSTPIGSRCPDCAAVRRVPTYTLSLAVAVKAFGVGLGAVLALVIAWVCIGATLKPIFPLYLLFLAGSGYLVGESISLAVNRKRGPWLQVVSGASVCGMLGLLDAINIISVMTPVGILGLILALALSLSRFR